MSGRLVLDSSVLIAILNGEPEAKTFLSIIAADDELLLGIPTLFEARIWCIRRRDAISLEWLDQVAGATWLIPFDAALERIAASAYRQFGKGLHAAKLNFGDAMAYAVAIHHGAPLLFKGGDFSQTDVPIHPASVILA